MTRINFREILILLLLGLLCGALWVSFFGFNVSVNPIQFFSHIGSAAPEGQLRLFWQGMISFGVLSGICMFVLLLFTFRYLVKPSIWAVIVFTLSVVLGAHFLVPLYYSNPVFGYLIRPIWSLGFEVSAVIASVLACVVVSRQRHNYAIKGTSA